MGGEQTSFGRALKSVLWHPQHAIIHINDDYTTNTSITLINNLINHSLIII